MIPWCEETLKICLLEGKHLWKAVGYFPFSTYLCGTWEFAQVCIWVVLVLWQWLGCCCCCRQKEELEQTVPSQDKWLMTKRESVFMSNNPFCDKIRFLRSSKLFVFKTVREFRLCTLGCDFFLLLKSLLTAGWRSTRWEIG